MTEHPTPSSSFLRRVFAQMMARGNARLALAWIALASFCAVFAPFIASSHPILYQHHDGAWSSPMLAYLTPADVSLTVAALAALALWLLRKRLPPRWPLRLWVLLLCLTLPLAAWLVRPPATEVLDRYRIAQAQGQARFVLRTLIPFSPSDRLNDQRDTANPHPWPPSFATGHYMGTRRSGADVLSNLVHACRIAMAIGLIATGIAVIIGVAVGALMGYFSGLVDILGMRVVEVFSAIPVFFILLSVAAFFPGNPELFPNLLPGVTVPRIFVMMVIIGLTSWVGDALFVRAEFLKLRKQDFVQAAIACGLPLRSILFRHMLPNGVTPVLVSASFGIASAILYESTLSFMGLGLIDQPSWGQMLADAISPGGSFYWWIATYPGAAIFLTVFAYNILGETIRDVIDPHSQRSTML